MNLFRKKKEKCIQDTELNELLLRTVKAYVAKARVNGKNFGGLEKYRPAGCRYGSGLSAGTSSMQGSASRPSAGPDLFIAGGVYGPGDGGVLNRIVTRADEDDCGCMTTEVAYRPMTLEEFEELMLHGFPKSRESFGDEVCWYVDRLGVSYAYIYKRANVSSSVFSSIISKEQMIPGKYTAMALAIALELNMEEAECLLAKAGCEFSDLEVTDLVAAYCIENKKHDVNEINRVLYEMGARLLGSEVRDQGKVK